MTFTYKSPIPVGSFEAIPMPIYFKIPNIVMYILHNGLRSRVKFAVAKLICPKDQWRPKEGLNTVRAYYSCSIVTALPKETRNHTPTTILHGTALSSAVQSTSEYTEHGSFTCRILAANQ